MSDDGYIDYSLFPPLNTGTYTINTGSLSPYATITSTHDLSNELSVKGTVAVDGDITIKGKSLNETLTNIEKRLAILKVNSELEEKWENLKALGDMYRDLEKEILEREEIYKILKK